MSIVVVLNKKSGQGSPLSVSQVDENWDAIEAAFLQTGDGVGDGTVTSVGFAAPAMFVVTNAPVTTDGTITLTLATQTANRIFAGPSTGSAAAPTFRVLVGDDLPSVPVAKGGTGNTAFTSGRVIVSIASNVIGVSAVTTTELGYLSGVTGDIQSQINSKQNTITVLPIVNGGTGANNVQNARLNLLPSVATNALKFARVNAGATDYELASFGVGSAGTDVNWINSGTTYSINIPDAGSGSRGLVNTVEQTFEGEKTFTNDPVLSARTGKQIIYIGGSNALSGTDEFIYDEGSNQLKVGSVRQTNVNTITASTVLDRSYRYVRCEQVSAIDVTLPTPDINYLGHTYIVKDSVNLASTRNITVKANGSSRLDNSVGGTIVINANSGCVGVQCVFTGVTYVWESIFKMGTV